MAAVALPAIACVFEAFLDARMLRPGDHLAAGGVIEVDDHGAARTQCVVCTVEDLREAFDRRLVRFGRPPEEGERHGGEALGQ